MPKICVLIPVHNEAQAIRGVVSSVRTKGLDVAVIDDGSTDDSGAIAREAGAFVIRHAQKSGKGASLRSGFTHALKEGYAAVVTLDGDGQHDAGDIDAFVALAQQHSPCMIVGNRMANPKGMPWVRFLTNRFMSFLISMACHQKIADTQCGYRYVDTAVLKDLPLRCDDFEIESEMLMKAAKKGCRIYSVPIRTIYQDEESKIHPVKDTIRFFVYFLKEISTSAPRD